MLRRRLSARREAQARAARADADRAADRALSADRDARREEARAEHDAAAKVDRAERRRAHEADWDERRRVEAANQARLDERRGYEQVQQDLVARTAEASRERARLVAARRATEAARRTTAVEARSAELARLVATRPRELATRRPSVTRGFATGGAGAVAAAVVDGLRSAVHPSGLPNAYAARYSPVAHELRVTFELPARAIVPTVARYEYVEAGDAVEPVSRSVEEGDALYRQLVAGAAVRVLAGVFDLTPPELVDRVALRAPASSEGHATGRPGAGTQRLVDVDATRAAVEALALDDPDLDPVAVLEALTATPTPEPTA